MLQTEQRITRQAIKMTELTNWIKGNPINSIHNIVFQVV